MNPSPVPALNWPFLKRTAIATLVTSLLVALFASVYYSMAWAGRYLLFSVWALVFFALTGLIFRSLAFSAGKAKGLGLIALKLTWLGAMFGVLVLWPPEGPARQSEAVAMFLGLSTPLIVLFLRALGFFLEAARRRGGSSPASASHEHVQERALNPQNDALKSR